MTEKKEYNLKINVILNVIKSLLVIVFPLITYPYAAKTLLPDGIGKYNYVIAIISYFQLLASLGVNTYAITEGSKIRNNQVKLNTFCSEIIWINVFSTLLSYVLLGIFILLGAFDNYIEIILICSITILFNTIGISWFYNIVEDFLFVTLRTIFFQILSIVLLFLLVKTPDDINIYCWLTVISAGGSNICNIFFLRKKLCITLNPSHVDWHSAQKHLKPIMLLFFASASSTIYMNSDKIMLGIFVDDYSVGIYSTSVKIISVVTTIIVAFRDVMLPRLSFYLSNNRKDDAVQLMYNGLSIIYMFIIPCIIGIIFLCRELVVFISSLDYISATSSLVILCFELLFAPISAFVAYQILIPIGKISTVTLSTVLGSIVNVLANVFLIPQMHENGAALTTVLAEIVVFIVLFNEVRKQLDLRIVFKDVLQYLIGTVCFIPALIFVSHLDSTLFKLILGVLFACIIYLLFLLLTKNKLIYGYYKKIKVRMKK